jgi:hypothetical protein
MSENPYQAPAAKEPAVGVLSGDYQDVISIARYQKGLISCILVYLLLIGAQFFVPIEARLIWAVFVILVGITGAVFVFLLAMKTHGIALGAILGIGTIIPCVGLIVLLIVNGRATSVLRNNGIDVGLFGADLSSF